MIKKLVMLSVLLLIPINSTWSQMDPRVKALGTMALYGTAGGAILGTATLAFGSSGRSIAKGASIGLYAGIIFGSYIVISHVLKQHRLRNPQRDDNYYPDSDSPYEEDEGGDGFFDASVDQKRRGQGWQPMNELASYRYEESIRQQVNERRGIDFVVPVFHMTF